VSKDENLTKAHVRYLENRLLSEAIQVGRFTLEQNQAGGSKLPESDRAARLRPSYMEAAPTGSLNGGPRMGPPSKSLTRWPNNPMQQAGFVRC